MKYLEAAIVVLQEAQRPLTTKEITDEALKRGLLSPSGKTPEATMSATLYLCVKNDAHARIRRQYEVGASRAQRGSVRWILGDISEP